jgi:hypothetical protein
VKHRILSNQIGHAFAIVTAVERFQPGDVISVNKPELASMVKFKATQYNKDVEVVVENGEDEGQVPQ